MEMAVANVEITSNEVKKPSSATSSNEVVPLTVFDLVSPNTPIPMILAFRPPMPENAALVDGLLKTLSHYPHLVGSFAPSADGRPGIRLDNTGVRIVETEVPTTLDENLPFDPATKLYFNLTPLMSGGTELLQIQLNRFACGGVVIGITIHHWVADATSYAAFLTSWSRMVRGMELPAPPPYHDRAAAVTARNPHKHEFDDAVERRKKPFADCSPDPDAAGAPRFPPATNLCVHYSKAFLGKLKSTVNGGTDDPVDHCSTFQCLLAQVWKTITRVRGLDGDGSSNFQFSVNGRRRVVPPVPTEYFGNFVLAVTATATVRELVEGPHAEIARKIRKAIREIDDEFFTSFVGYGSSVKAEEVMSEMVGPVHSLGPNVFNTSWLGLGFDEVDFAGGGLGGFLVPGIPVEGFSLLLPAYEDGGGVNVLIALRDKDSADLFRSLAYSLE